MKKISTDSLLRIYSKVSIVMAMGFMVALFTYFSKLPATMFGPIDKGLFSTIFTVSFDSTTGEFPTLVVSNSALIFVIICLAINIAFVIITWNKKTTETLIQSSMLYNTVINIVLIFALLIFYMNIPANINGDIIIGFFQYKFYVLNDSVVGGFNFAYILTTVYLVYNIVIALISSRSYDIVEEEIK